MNYIAGNTNILLRKLMDSEGLSLSQACESLDLDIEAGKMALMEHKKVSVEDIIEQFRPEAIEILIDVARTGTRDMDRVKACQILLEGKGVMPEVNAAAASVLLERFRKLKEATGFIDVQDVKPKELTERNRIQEYISA